MLNPQTLEQIDAEDESPSEFESVEDELVLPTHPDGSLKMPVARVNLEAIMGLIAAFMIGMPAPFVAVFIVIWMLEPIVDPRILGLAAGLTFLVSVYLVATIMRIASKAIEGDRPVSRFPNTSTTIVSALEGDEPRIPLAFAMAIRLPKWWWFFMKPFIAIWWIGHFLVAAILGHVTGRGIMGVNNPNLFSIIIALAVTMAFIFAANLYLMLAIAVSIPRPRIWLIAWKFRIFVDLIVTLAMIAFP